SAGTGLRRRAECSTRGRVFLDAAAACGGLPDSSSRLSGTTILDSHTGPATAAGAIAWAAGSKQQAAQSARFRASGSLSRDCIDARADANVLSTREADLSAALQKIDAAEAAGRAESQSAQRVSAMLCDTAHSSRWSRGSCQRHLLWAFCFSQECRTLFEPSAG